MAAPAGGTFNGVPLLKADFFLRLLNVCFCATGRADASAATQTPAEVMTCVRAAAVLLCVGWSDQTDGGQRERCATAGAGLLCVIGSLRGGNRLAATTL